MVLETSWETRAGLGGRARRAVHRSAGTTSSERSRTHRRSPTDYDADHVLLRTVRCVQGWVEIHLDCEPGVRLRRPGGRVVATRGPGYNEACAGSEGMDLELRLRHRHEPRLRGPARAARARSCTKGEVAFAALGWSEHALPHDLRRGRRAARAATAHHWQRVARAGAPSPTTRGARYLQRSALTLKGLDATRRPGR